VLESKLNVEDEKSPEKIRAVVELLGKQNTLPSVSKTPLSSPPVPGYVPDGVVTVFVIGA